MKLKDIVIFVVIAVVAFLLYKKFSENSLFQSNNKGKNTSPPPTPEAPNNGSSGSSSGGNLSGSGVPAPKPPTSEDLKNLSPKDNGLLDSYNYKFNRNRFHLLGGVRRY